MSEDQAEVIADIKAMYSQAVKATTENVKLGDILCNHIKCGCLIVTEEVLSRTEPFYDFFFIVGKTYGNYRLLP